MTTLAYVVVDLASRRARMISAGHVPPLVRRLGGDTDVLAVEGDPPLGVLQHARYHEHAFELSPGSTVVLVTDGAVEVRGEALDRGLERLRELVVSEADLGRLCDAIARGEVRGRSADDDVAVLAARLAPLSDRLRTLWPARAETLADLRSLLRRWLAACGAAPAEAYDITVAVQEASTNAIEHAYAPGVATFELDATHVDGVITVAIRDRGRWRPSRGRHRGRGLLLMRALMESVDVIRRDDGTTLIMRRTLERPAA